MPTGPLSQFLSRLRRRVAVRNAGEVPDRDLLQRFAGGRDEDAFATLFERYSVLVYGVCRRLLSDDNDADDAFQATFLVLARKAGAIAQPELLANWLYGVAYRTAQKARTEGARRRTRYQQVTDMPDSKPVRGAEWEDVCRVLDDEVRRLPAKFRAPLILCYLQGNSREEAAAQLGSSAGAVKGRLERGRDLLRSRLARRGVSLAVGSLAPLLAENALSAPVPVMLSCSTVKAALLFVAGKWTAGNSAAALANAVLRASWMMRVKLSLAILLLSGLAATGALTLHPSRALELTDPTTGELVSKAAFKTEPHKSPPAAGGDAADTPKDNAVKEELRRLEGTWTPVAIASNGVLQTAEELRPAGFDAVAFRLAIGPGTFRLAKVSKLHARTKIEPLQYVFKVDPTRKPKEMDLLVTTDGESKGTVERLIYEVQDDELRICSSDKVGERPDKFDFTAPFTTVLYERHKTDTAKSERGK